MYRVLFIKYISDVSESTYVCIYLKSFTNLNAIHDL